MEGSHSLASLLNTEEAGVTKKELRRSSGTSGSAGESPEEEDIFKRERKKEKGKKRLHWRSLQETVEIQGIEEREGLLLVEGFEGQRSCKSKKEERD